MIRPARFATTPTAPASTVPPAHRGRTVAAALVFASLLLAVAGCRPDAGVERGPGPVILVSIDTLRPDHLGCYGYAVPTSPALDATLCRDGVVFEQAISHAPSTLASHASMLSGLVPARHGASIERKRAVAPRVETLAERLAAAGYRTASFNNGVQIGTAWGLGQGFDVYTSLPDDRLSTVLAPALDWLDGAVAAARGGGAAPGEEKVFLFLHTYEPHHPYTPSAADLERVGAAPYDGPLGGSVGFRELLRINHGRATASAADRDFIVAAYDAEIRSVDRALGDLLAALRRRGLYDDALVIFTSDHGEEMGEHGAMGWHSHTLYDELLRVPLVLKLPGGRAAGRRIAPQVRLADLTPTVLDLAGLPVPAGLDGDSLLPLVEGDPEGRRPVVAELDARRQSAAIRTAEWKLWDERLFHLAEDPEERRDVAAAHPEVAAALERRRDAALDASAPGEDVPSKEGEVELTPEEIERLRALGYL